MVKKKQKGKWGLIIGILFVLFILAYIFSGLISLMMGTEKIREGNVAVIPIRGIILSESSTGFFDTSAAVSGQIVKDIEEAATNPQYDAIILEINSQKME